MEKLILVCCIIAGLWLATQRWAWAVAFGIGAIASWFTVLAMIVHFQILGAVGMFILAYLLTMITAAILD